MNTHHPAPTRFARLAVPLTALLGLGLTLLLWMGLAHGLAAAQAVPPVHVDNSTGRGQLFLGEALRLDLAGNFVGAPQPSPDGRLLAVPAVPTGAETANFAHIHILDSQSGQEVTTLPGHTPRWDAETGRLAYVSPGLGYGLYDPQTGKAASTAQPPTILAPLLIPEQTAPRLPLPAGPVTYPAIIRVIHRAANSCRSVPVGQIDLIPFEDYVARVVPHEVPALWPAAAVKAQAVAARTYGWYQILQNHLSTYDVSDYADYQMMCDDHHPASDAAVTATAGIYLAAVGDPDLRPIVAMYSAENGHPTKTNSAVSYLQAVPDLFALGKVRSGHGYGLSQWGAYRRANADHNYLQILGHYYTDVTVQNGLDPNWMVGALVDPPPPTPPKTSGFLAPGGLYWRAITPAQPISPSLVLTATTGLTNGIVFSQTRGLWQPVASFAEGTVITAQFWLSGTQMDQRVLVVDRTPPPAPSMVLPITVTQRTVPVTVSAQGGDRVGLSGGWMWQGESLFHTANSGRVISDGGALNGLAWQAQAGVDQPGAWYGPYTDVLAPGRAYRALFRLRAGTPPTSSVPGLVSNAVIARLDVTDQLGEVRLGLRDLRAVDFSASGEYVQIGVDFYVFDWADGLEFRVDWRGNTDLAWDQVQIWTLPTASWPDGPLPFQLPAQEGAHIIQALAFDLADNPSAPISVTVNAVDVAGPGFGADFSPTGWQRTLPVVASLSLADELSGLAAAGGLLHLNGPIGSTQISATLTQPERPDLAQRIQSSVSALADGRYTATFQAGDRAGHTAMSSAFPLWVDVTPPVVTGTITSTVAGAPLSTTNGWHLSPVRVILDGADATSGLARISYDLGDAIQPYLGPVVFNTAGHFGISFGSTDVAGNLSELQSFLVKVDLAPPTVTVSLDQGNPVLAVVRWSGGDDASGVARFEVESRVGAGAWLAVDPPPGGGEASFVVEAGTILQVRVRAVDGAERVGAWGAVSVTGAARQLYLPAILSAAMHR